VNDQIKKYIQKVAGRSIQFIVLQNRACRTERANFFLKKGTKSATIFLGTKCIIHINKGRNKKAAERKVKKDKHQKID
jgi:hypothetical protein